MDIFATGKAIDLYSMEVNRRIEELEKTIKQKDKTIEERDKSIKHYKDRELVCAAMLIVGLVLMTIALFIIFN